MAEGMKETKQDAATELAQKIMDEYNAIPLDQQPLYSVFSFNKGLRLRRRLPLTPQELGHGKLPRRSAPSGRRWRGNVVMPNDKTLRDERSPVWALEIVPLKLNKKGVCCHGVLGVGWGQKWCYKCYLNYRARKRRAMLKERSQEGGDGK